MRILSDLSYGFLLLLLYSFLGWCGEMAYCSLGQGRLCEKRGFLNGPLCPIYGHGALLVLWVLHGGCENPLLTFFLGLLLTSAVEYVTSFAMEKLFHMRWWDYSKHRFNLNGRVCLLNSTLFGLACVFLCHAAHPFFSGLVRALLSTRAGLPLTIGLLVVYLVDVVLSVRSAVRVSAALEKLHALHDELAGKLEALRQERLQRADAQHTRLGEAVSAVKERAEEHLEAAAADARQRLHACYKKLDFLDRRLVGSFPTLRSIRHGEALDKLRAYWAQRRPRP